ncbi:polynucleotide adenylyltransferase region [Chondrocystis sp. NIES-4102]|nr:polynucleotide adenylyltransferase region [Chondrocystis sp. NIES-4102]
MHNNIEKIRSYLNLINFPCDLELGDDAYLVGGSVRDALLQRYKDPIDLDFVVPNKAIQTAQKIAHRYQAGFVVLDEQRAIARVVFKQGTLDFAQQVGTSIFSDLQRRDFTINAIAYHLSSQSLIDPHGGLRDLDQGILRMVSLTNLEEDPLRLLRAYRQAAQLKFTVEADTRKAIRDRAYLLKTIAAERVQAELNYLFTAPEGNRWLAHATADQLLQLWLPSVDLAKINQLDAVKEAVTTCLDLGLKQPQLLLLTILATLVSPQPTIAETELTQLKYSRAQIKAVVKTVQHLPQLQNLTTMMSLSAQYLWFLATKETFPLIMARAIALKVDRQLLDTLLQRYLDPSDPVVYPQPLVTGKDLMDQLNLTPSPLIGKLLNQIQIAQIEAKISTPKQAIDWAQSLLDS